jgi:hypothetical protein
MGSAFVKDNNVSVVVVTDRAFKDMMELDSNCRELGVPLVGGLVHGAAGFVFNDFHGSYSASDGSGVDSREVMTSCSPLSPLCSLVGATLYGKQVPLSAEATQEGDHLLIRSVGEPHQLGLGDRADIRQYRAGTTEAVCMRCAGTVVSVTVVRFI